MHTIQLVWLVVAVKLFGKLVSQTDNGDRNVCTEYTYRGRTILVQGGWVDFRRLEFQTTVFDNEVPIAWARYNRFGQLVFGSSLVGRLL